MPDTAFLIAVDVGAVGMKSILIHRDESGRQSIVNAWLTRTAAVEKTLPDLLREIEARIRQEVKLRGGKAAYDLMLVGHPPEVEEFAGAKQVWQISHEEALRAVAERVSAEGGAVVMDLGSHRGMIAVARYGRVMIESWDFGVGEKVWEFLQKGTTESQLQAWLPFEAPEDAISNYLGVKSVYPALIPTTTFELAVEQAMAKMMLRQMLAQVSIPWPEVELVMLTGGVLSQPRRASQSVSMFLDGAEPEGVLQLKVDANLLLFAIGGAAMAWSEKDFGIGQALIGSVCPSLATVISLQRSSDGKGGSGKVVEATLDQKLKALQRIKLLPDEVAVIPWAEGEAGSVEIDGRWLNVSPRRKGRVNKGMQGRWSVEGGEVGLVVDTRSRPVLLEPNEKRRRIQLLKWSKQLNAHGQVGNFDIEVAEEGHE